MREAMSNGTNTGEKRSDAGGAGKGNPRRRYFRRRKPATKAQEPAPKPESRKPQEQTPAKSRPRTNANAKAEAANKNERDRRGGRRRRRRSRSDRVETVPVVQESILATIDHEYTPPKAVFVYTYVLRPGAPSSHEFRPEHFSRVGRRLEDFEIDLSPLFRDEKEARRAFKPARQAEPEEAEAPEFLEETDDE